MTKLTKQSAAERPPAVAVSFKVGERITIEAAATSAGLLSIGALVTGILLSTAVIVAAGTRRYGLAEVPPRQPELR